MIEDFAAAAAEPPDGAEEVYIRARRGASRSRLTVAETVYVRASELTIDRVAREVRQLRERYPADRLWVDVLVKGRDRPYVPAVELPRAAETRGAGSSPVDGGLVVAASTDPMGVLVTGLVTLALYSRDVQERQLDTIDDLSGKLREADRELGRLRARVTPGAAPVDDDDDDDRQPSALDNLSAVLAETFRKVQASTTADPVELVKASLRSLSPRERAERVARFLEDPEIQGMIDGTPTDGDAPSAPTT